MEEEDGLISSSPNNNTSPNPNNKPKIRIFDPRTQKNLKPLNITKITGGAESFHGYNTGLGESMFDKGTIWGTDINEDDVNGSINERRAQEQGFGFEAAAGLARIGTKGFAEFAKIVGYAGGTIAGIAENIGDGISGKDEHSFLETAFNNKFVKTVDEIHQSTNDSYLPVYVSESVANGGFFDKIKSPEFWATEGADGVGFMLSMMAPGAAFKALGIAEKIAVGSAKLANMSKLGKSIEKSVELVARLGGKTGSAVDKINDVLITGLNTYTESGAEAAGAMDNVDKNKDKIDSNFKNSKEFENQVTSNNIKLQQLVSSGQLSQEESMQQSSDFQNKIVEDNFKNIKGTVGANTFWANAAVLSLSNYRQTKMLYGTKKAGFAEKMMEPTLKQKALNGLEKTAESFASEGGEELFQTSTSNRNVEKAIDGTLSKGYFDNISQDVVESAGHLFKTLGTTEGVMSAFLGGVLGRGTEYIGSVYHGSAKKERTENNRVHDLIERSKNNINDLTNTDLYENEDTVDDKGNVSKGYKTDDEGKRIFKPESVKTVLNAVASVSKKSAEFDKAVAEHDYDKVESLQNEAESHLIQGFVTEEGVALDALEQHLNVLFEQGADQDSKKKTQDRVKETIDHARHLQKAFNTFNDFYSHFGQINNENASKEDILRNANELRNQHLDLKSNQFYQNKKIKLINEKIKDRRNDIYDSHENLDLSERFIPKDESVKAIEKGQELSLNEIRDNYLKSDVYYKESVVKNDLFTNILLEEKERRVQDLKDTQDSLDKIWDPKTINENVDRSIKENNELREDLATKPEVHQGYLDSINNSTDLSDLDIIGKNMTSKKVISPILSKAYNAKKTELENIDKDRIDSETIDNSEISTNTEIDKEFEGVDDVVDKTKINTPEDVDDVPSELQEETELDNEETDEYVKDIVIDENNDVTQPGVVLRFLNNVSDFFNNFISFARTPMEKKGIPVTFEVGGEIDGRNDENIASKLFKELASSKMPYISIAPEDLYFLENHLPIITEVKYGNKSAKTILETRLSENENDGNISKQNEIFDRESLPFRRELIKFIIENNYSTNNIVSEIKKQLNDTLVTTDQETSVFNLQSIKTLKTKKDRLDYIKNNLFYVSKKGNLVNTLNGEPDFTYKITKGAGEIYLIIPNNNNSKFNLKLNTKRISEEKATVIYDLLKILSLKTLTFKGKNIEKVPLSAIEGKAEFQDVINGLITEIKLLKSEIKKPTIQDLLLLLMHTTTSNSRTSIGRTDDNTGDWTFGSMMVNSKNPKDLTTVTVKEFENDSKKSEIVRFIQLKRHNLLIGHDVFNVSNDNYLEYLVDNEILNTNVVAYDSFNHNETASFQGQSKVYIDSSIKTNTPKKKTSVKEVKSSVKIDAPTLFSKPSEESINESEETLDNIKSELQQLEQQRDESPEDLKEMFDGLINNLKSKLNTNDSEEVVSIKNKDTVKDVVSQQIDKFNNSSVKDRVSLRKEFKDGMMSIDPSSVEVIDKLFNVKDGITNTIEVNKILNALYNNTVSNIKNNNPKKC